MPAENGQVSGGDTLAWTSLPLRDEPPAKTLLLVAILLAAALIASFQGGLLIGLLALGLLLIVMGPYFLPRRYELSETGVKVFFPLFNRNRPWSVYKRYVPQKDGVFLSTYAIPSRLDSFRGDFLRFSRTIDRDAVLELVRRHVATP